MSVLPLQVARVSMRMQGSLLLGTLQQGQVNLLKVQQQLATGQRLSRASDDPAAALNIDSLKRQIAVHQTYSANLDFAAGFLAQADAALGDLNALINEARSIASSQIGAASTTDERAAQAQVVASLLSQALDLANRRYQGQALFGGQNGTCDPFVSIGGGYKYQGTDSQQAILTPTGGTIEYSLGGDAAFGAVSSQVRGYQNLTPALTADTRLSDLGGARSAGVSTGPINMTLGVSTTTVDLSNAATVGDVVSMINTALATAGSDATVALAGGALLVNGDSTRSLVIADSLSGTTAADLGITLSLGAGESLTGSTVAPRIVNTTPLASLNGGAGIDDAGIILTNGANSATLTLAGLLTVEDFLNAVNTSGTHVRAEINAAGNGIDLFNPLSGTALRVGENGGHTAAQLGIRSLHAATNLADLNNATGITAIASVLSGPKGSITITGTDGAVFSVPMDAVRTPAQLIAAINGAAGNTSVTAVLNTSGNGITLSDASGGSGDLSVAPGNNYAGNGTDLGILKTGSGGTLTGTDITFSTDDIRIIRRDGTSFSLSVAGAVSVQDILDRIHAADGNTDPGSRVIASLSATGNGIQLSDPSAGVGLLTVTALNGSEAAAQLGLPRTASATAPGVIVGTDVNPLQPRGVFTSLALLRDALLKDDSQEITRAAEMLQADGTRAIRARGILGAREKDVSARQDAATSQIHQLQGALSLLADTDFTEAATRLQQLQTAYQASLQVAQATRNLSLLDFLE